MQVIGAKASSSASCKSPIASGLIGTELFTTRTRKALPLLNRKRSPKNVRTSSGPTLCLFFQKIETYLLDMDFEALGETNTEARHIWLYEMQAAKAASGNAGREQRFARAGWSDTIRGSDISERSDIGVVVDTEGSLRFRRRKKKASG
jgi:hypothetical protein